VALSITLSIKLGAAVLLVSLTLWLQYAGVTALMAWVTHTAEGDIATITLHGLQILLWASCYRWLCFPSWESALYFSPSSYATVGYGDVLLPSEWRILGPLEGIVGLILFYLQ
jgi:voltage-gated potassium channel